MPTLNIEIENSTPFARALLVLFYSDQDDVTGAFGPELSQSFFITTDASGEASLTVAMPEIPGHTITYVRYEITGDKFANLQTDEFFLDSGKSYLDGPYLTLTGLDHLEGMEVGVFTDGSVHPNRTVVDGSITLEREANIVHVGLPYESIIQPMRMDIDDQIGNAMGTVKQIRGLTVRVMDTLGVKYANNPKGPFHNIQFRKTSDAMNQPPPLVTGDVIVDGFEGDFDEDATVVLKQDQPLPWTLIAMTVHYQTTGER